MDEEKYKAEFLSYFANVIFYATNRYFKTKNKIKSNETELNEETITSFSSSERNFENDVFSILKGYVEKKVITSRQERVLILTAIGETDSQIGDKLNVTASTIRATRKQARDNIKRHINLKGE